MSELRRVAIRVSREEAEIAAAGLLERYPGGLEERAAGEWVELAVYTDGAGEAELGRIFADLSSQAVESGWEDRWKEFHRPVRAGGLWIGPPWIEPPPDEPVVVVEPGRAFGTGAHPTTRATIEALSRLDRGSVLDAGCGSGVTSVAAARLGFAPVTAVDSDEVALEVAAATAQRNDVAIEVFQAEVLRDELPRVDVVVANIELAVVDQLLDRVPASVAVTSGYFVSDGPRSAGWTPVDRIEIEGWAADVLVAPH